MIKEKTIKIFRLVFKDLFNYNYQSNMSKKSQKDQANLSNLLKRKGRAQR